MATDVVKTQVSGATMEKVLLEGDLAQLTNLERMQYYRRVCESLGLNPMTKPFQYIRLSGRLTFYATKDCTEQLRKIHGVSITGLSATNDKEIGVYTVVATAQDATGRTDSATGAVFIENLKGENLSNAIMKAETKAKRRVTLSIAGLSVLDDSERESVKGAQVVKIDDDFAALPEPEKGAGDGYMGKPEPDAEPGPVVYDHGEPKPDEDNRLGWDGDEPKQPELA